LGAARKIQAITLMNEGIMKATAMAPRMHNFAGTSVRATSQASGTPTARQPAVT
jgi:hypothetical protein